MWKALLSWACPGAAGRQAAGGKEAEGKLVGANLPTGRPTGIHHHESLLSFSPLPRGLGKYGDLCRLATGKRNKTPSTSGSSRRMPFWVN